MKFSIHFSLASIVCEKQLLVLSILVVVVVVVSSGVCNDDGS